MGIHVRNKGHAGEREFAKLLARKLGIDYLERNIDQVRDGGADIMSLPPLAIEVKRCQQLSFNAWRKQARMQCTTTNPIPVLAYRQNHRKWMVQMMCVNIIKKSYVVDKESWIEMEFETFVGVCGRILEKNKPKGGKRQR